MTMLDLYRMATARIGEGRNLSLEPRISPVAPYAWTDQKGGLRYWYYKPGVLHVVYQLSSCTTWDWLDLTLVDGSWTVQGEQGLSFQEAMMGIHDSNPWEYVGLTLC